MNGDHSKEYHSISYEPHGHHMSNNGDSITRVVMDDSVSLRRTSTTTTTTSSPPSGGIKIPSLLNGTANDHDNDDDDGSDKKKGKKLFQWTPKNLMIFLLLVCVALEIIMKSYDNQHIQDATTTTVKKYDDQRDLSTDNTEAPAEAEAEAAAPTGVGFSVTTTPQPTPLPTTAPPTELSKTTISRPEAPPDVKIPIRLQQAMEQNDPNRSIVLVHVGEAGGLAIKQNIAAKCNEMFPNANDGRRDNCYARFPLEHNKLANQTRNFVHMHYMDPNVISQATTFLVTLRNPMDRLHSIYRSTHPSNCNKEAKLPNGKRVPPNYGCWAIEHKRMEPHQEYYKMWKECFPSGAMEDFAQALLPPYDLKPNPHFIAKGFTPEKQAQCRHKARQLVQGVLTGHAAPHMHFNYKHYAEATVKKYPQKETFVVRSEHEFEDMVQLDVAMGGVGMFSYSKEKITHMVDGSNENHYLPSTLSKEAMEKLCCVLQEEIQYYFIIFDRAVNMDGKDRSDASTAFRHQCSIPREISWTTWMDQCRDKVQQQEQLQLQQQQQQEEQEEQDAVE